LEETGKAVEIQTSLRGGKKLPIKITFPKISKQNVNVKRQKKHNRREGVGWEEKHAEVKSK